MAFSEEAKKKMSEAAFRRPPFSEETRKKMSESAQKRWETMDPATEIRFRKSRSQGMKRYWKKYTKKERKMIGRKMAMSHFKRKLLIEGLSLEEIELKIKEKYGES